MTEMNKYSLIKIAKMAKVNYPKSVKLTRSLLDFYVRFKFKTDKATKFSNIQLLTDMCCLISKVQKHTIEFAYLCLRKCFCIFLKLNALNNTRHDVSTYIFVI